MWWLIEKFDDDIATTFRDKVSQQELRDEYFATRISQIRFCNAVPLSAAVQLPQQNM
jgi:hypothetical protein